MQTTVQSHAKRLPPPERRDQVLDGARDVVLRSGYAGLSMNAVARAARVTRPVVYDCFANAEELLESLLEREEERAIAAVVGAAPDLSRPGGADVDALVVEAMEVFLRAVRDQPETWRLVLLPPDGAPELVREHIKAGRRVILRQLESVAGMVLAARGGPAGLDLELFAEFVFQFCERSIRLMLADPQEFPAARIVELARQIVAGPGAA